MSAIRLSQALQGHTHVVPGACPCQTHTFRSCASVLGEIDDMEGHRRSFKQDVQVCQTLF